MLIIVERWGFIPRPSHFRHVMGPPRCDYFIPCKRAECETSVLTLDQYEAIRLAELEGLNQEEAANRMEISRPTFGRILEEAHRVVADALVNRKAIRIKIGVEAPVYAGLNDDPLLVTPVSVGKIVPKNNKEEKPCG